MRLRYNRARPQIGRSNTCARVRLVRRSKSRPRQFARQRAGGEQRYQAAAQTIKSALPSTTMKEKRACLPDNRPAELQPTAKKMTGEITMPTDVSRQARAAAILARLDRLPITRH